jgi:hypothetical protein
VSRYGIPGWEQVIPDLPDSGRPSAGWNEEAHDRAEKGENLSTLEDAIDVELPHIRLANALVYAVKPGDRRRIDGVNLNDPGYRIIEGQRVGEFLSEASA